MTKRVWHANKYYTNRPFSWNLLINAPHEDDYYENQWAVIITFFGWQFSFATWKE